MFTVLNKLGGKRKLSWNPGKRELLLLNEHRLKIDSIPVEILILNTSEWQMISGVQSTLINHVPMIVITDGSKGGKCIIKGEGEFSFVSSGNPAVEATGAGDSFAVGLVAGKIWGYKPKQAIGLGVTNAGSVVNYIGAKEGLLTRSAIESQAGIS